jgi:hypothetical protein
LNRRSCNCIVIQLPKVWSVSHKYYHAIAGIKSKRRQRFVRVSICCPGPLFAPPVSLPGTGKLFHTWRNQQANCLKGPWWWRFAQYAIALFWAGRLDKTKIPVSSTLVAKRSKENHEVTRLVGSRPPPVNNTTGYPRPLAARIDTYWCRGASRALVNQQRVSVGTFSKSGDDCPEEDWPGIQVTGARRICFDIAARPVGGELTVSMSKLSRSKAVLCKYILCGKRNR